MNELVFSLGFCDETEVICFQVNGAKGLVSNHFTCNGEQIERSMQMSLIWESVLLSEVPRRCVVLSPP